MFVLLRTESHTDGAASAATDALQLCSLLPSSVAVPEGFRRQKDTTRKAMVAVAGAAPTSCPAD